MGQGFREASGLLAVWAARTNRQGVGGRGSQCGHPLLGRPPFFPLPSHLSSYRTLLPGWLRPCFTYPAFSLGLFLKRSLFNKIDNAFTILLVLLKLF